MKFTSTKEFRTNLASYLEAAEDDETVYLIRPGGKVLKISRVPEGDRDQILMCARDTGKKTTCR